MKHVGMAVVNVQQFRTSEGLSTDKNGKQDVILLPIAGKIPNRQVLAGTIAESNGFVVGKTYLVNITKLEPTDKAAESRNLAEYPHQFNWTVLKELDAFEILQASKELGSPEVYNVDKKVEEPTSLFSSGAEGGL